MNKQYLTYPLKLLGNRLLFIFISFFFFIPLSWIIKLEGGYFYFSLIICLIYFLSVYTDTWKLASKDLKSYSENKPYFLKGLVMGFLSEIPDIIILVVALVLANGSKFFISNLVFIVWNLPFIGFLGLPSVDIIKMETVTSYYYLALFYIPILTFLGYFAGMKRFTIGEKILPKIVYKQEKKK